MHIKPENNDGEVYMRIHSKDGSVEWLRRTQGGIKNTWIGVSKAQIAILNSHYEKENAIH